MYKYVINNIQRDKDKLITDKVTAQAGTYIREQWNDDVKVCLQLHK